MLPGVRSIRSVTTRSSSRGFTLVEILASTTITTVLIIVTASMFKTSTDVWNRGRSEMDVFLEARASLDYLSGDIEAAVTGKHQDMSPYPIDQAGGDPEDHPFAKRYYVPIEFNRSKGEVFDSNYRQNGGHFTDRPANSPNKTSSRPLASTKGFANAIGAIGSEDTNYHEYYDALAMLTLSPLTRQVWTNIERGKFAGGTQGNRWNSTDPALLGDGFARNQGDVCVAGYYCAYTYDSPLPGSRASVKLHRHFRDSGNWWAGVSSGHTINGTDTGTRNRDYTIGGQDFDSNLDRRPVQSRAHVLVYKLGNVMTPCLERGIYANGKLPYLLKPVDYYGMRTHRNSEELETIEPFPANPAPPIPDDTGPDYASTLLTAAPPYVQCYEPRQRDDRTTEYYLYGDEPLAFNVVRFKATPLRRVDGKLLGAEQINSAPLFDNHLTSNRDEWPVVVAPDIVDIELTVIDDATAAKFVSYEDWTRWNDTSYRGGMLKRLVDENSRTFRTRVHVRGAEHLDE